MDGVLCNIEDAFNRDEKDREYPQSREGFFLELDPMPGALDAMRQLRRRKNTSVYILSRPSFRNAHCWTEKALWIEKHLGYEMVQNMILTGHKNLLLSDKSYLVDDYDKGAGQEVWNTAGRLLHFNSPKFPNWQSILEYLL